VEIERVELGALPQALPIVDAQGASAQGDQAISSQILDHPVDMNRGQAERIAQFRLGHGKRTGLLILGQANGPEAHQQLAQKVGKPLMRRSLAQANHPQAEHRRIDDGVPPQGIRNGGMARIERLCRNF
jgi:hypothetical protein